MYERGDDIQRAKGSLSASERRKSRIHRSSSFQVMKNPILPSLQRKQYGVGNLCLGCGLNDMNKYPQNVAQRQTRIEYAVKQNFGYGVPVGGVYPNNVAVGQGVRACLDRNDPVSGSGTGVGALANAMIALAGGPFAARNWLQGHLLNSNTGGLAVDSNLVPITHEANTQHEGLVERGVKVNLHNANTPARLLDANNPGYDVEYHVLAQPTVHPYGANSPDINLITSWRYWRAGQNGWSAWRRDTIDSRSAGAAYAVDPNWQSAGAMLGAGGGVNRRVVGVGHVAMVAWGGVVPANMTHAIIDAVLGVGGAIAGVNRILSWHSDQPAP